MKKFLLASLLLAMAVGCDSGNQASVSDEYKNSVRSPETNPKTPMSAEAGNGATGTSAPPMTAP